MTLKAGIIGFGKMGKLHCKGYLAVGVEVVGIYDMTSQDTEHKNFDSVAELIKQCDVVSICSPSSTHKAIAELCIKSGIAVMVEKPLALHVDDCKVLLELSKKHNTVLSVGHIERFNASFQVLKENISAVGKIECVQAERTNPSSGRINDADVISDLSVHDIDLINNICGGNRITDIEISSVVRCGRGKDIDKIIASGKIKDITVGIHTSRISDTAVRQISVRGDKGVLKADLLGRKVFFNDTEIAVQPCDQIISQIGAFVNAITTKTEPVVTGFDGLFAVESADEIRAVANSTETSI